MARQTFLPVIKSYAIINSCVFVLMFLLAKQTLGQTSYTWNRSISGQSWATSTNWTPTRSSPAATDILIISPGNTQTITNVPAQTIRRLTISASSTITLTGSSTTLTIGNGTGTDLTVASGSSLTISTNLNITLASSVTADISGTLIVSAGRIFNTDGTSVVTTVTGTIQSSGTVTCTTGSKLVFNNTGIYIHAQDSGVIPTATWNAGSTCRITGTISTTAFGDPGGVSQSFSNFVWDCASQTSVFSLSAFGNGSMTITGTLTVNRTGSGALAIGVSYQPVLTVANYTQTGGNVYINNNSVASRGMTVTGNFIINQNTTTSTLFICTGAGDGTLSIGGDFTFSAGTINRTAGIANFAFNGNTTQNYIKTGGTFSQAVDFSINSGATVNFGTNIINGSSGSFTLNSGGSIITANTNGISTSAGTGTIQVSGTKTYVSGSSVTYNGSSAQVTGNGLPATVSNLTINNASGVTLSGDVTVSSSLTLTNGNLTTNANKATLSATGSITGETSGRYVIGNLEAIKTVGTSSSSFGGMGVTIGAGTNDIGTVTILRRSGSGAAVTSSTNGNTSINRTWNITITGSQPTNGRSVTFSWLSDDDNGKDITQMQIWRQLTGSDPWVAIGPLTDVSGTRTLTINTTGFSLWTASSASSVLPISLLSFTGTRSAENHAVLSWITASELNNKGFEIQKSLNGIDFAPVGFVKGMGDSQTKIEYTFADTTNLRTAYYRLKQVDWDDSFTYSFVVRIAAHKTDPISVFPNPATTRITITGNPEVMEDNNLSIELLSRNGSKILYHQGSLQSANQVMNEQINNLAPGIYILHIYSIEHSYWSKFQKI